MAEHTNTTLSDVPEPFLPFIRGKTVVGGSVRLGPMGKSFELPTQPVEAFFAAGRLATYAQIGLNSDNPEATKWVDSIKFSDGSSYCDESGMPRYFASSEEDPSNLSAVGLYDHGFCWFMQPPKL